MLVGEEQSNPNILGKLWSSVQAVVYGDNHTSRTAPLKSTTLDTKGFATHLKVKLYTTTCSSAQRSRLHIQPVQSDTHSGVCWWKVPHKSGISLLCMRENHVQMLLNVTAKPKDFSLCQSAAGISLHPLDASFSRQSSDNQWKWERWSVPISSSLCSSAVHVCVQTGHCLGAPPAILAVKKADSSNLIFLQRVDLILAPDPVRNWEP